MRSIIGFTRDDEAFGEEIEVSHIPFQMLRSLFPNAEDPNLVLSCCIGLDEGKVLNEYLPEPLKFDIDDYFVDASVDL